MKINIAMPVYRMPIPIETVISISKLLKIKEHDVNLVIMSGFQTAEARNKLVDASKNSDYIFWMDADSVVEPKDLLQLLSNDKEIVTGIYTMRGFPYTPVVYRLNSQGTTYIFENEIKDGLHEIDGCGFGCCLTKTSIFNDLSKPYFEFNSFGNNSTEDFDFCRKARKQFKIYADWNVKIGHVGTKVFTTKDFQRLKDNQKNMLKMVKNFEV